MALEPAGRARTSRMYRVGTAVVEWWTRRYTRRVEFFAAESRLQGEFDNLAAPSMGGGVARDGAEPTHRAGR